MASAVAGSAISGIAYKDMPREKVYLVVIFAVIQVMENLDCISIFFLILIFFISVGCHVRKWRPLVWVGFGKCKSQDCGKNGQLF